MDNIFLKKVVENDIDLLQAEMNKYIERMKNYLPVEKKIKELKRKGFTIEEIKQKLNISDDVLSYVPETLFHGSPKELEVIGTNESTQQGNYVYATDNPIHALFFSIFRNSSIARGHINEYIDENGEYRVKYEIDERVPNALNEIITDTNVFIHVCNGKQFIKPNGEDFIGREWVSNQAIFPTDKIKVNVKEFFDMLEKQNLIEYSSYDKSKDYPTVLNMLGQSYAYGLTTERAQNIEEYDKLYDDFIAKNFPEQLLFSKRIREDIKKINNSEIDANLSNIEQKNYKLRKIKQFTDNFIIGKKDENGKVHFEGNYDKINHYMNEKIEKKEVNNMSEQIPFTYDGKTINVTRFTINSSTNENIKLPYALAIPENINENAKLIVSCSTPKSSPRKYVEEIEHLEKDEKDNVYEQMPNYVKKLMSEGYPVLFPIIPRFRGYYSTFLGSQVRNNDTSELIEWIDKDPEHYTNLEKENIDRLKDVDKQVYAMIGDSKKILENYTNIDEKVIMTGYSAGAHFANGFTALHPDIVDMEICGGQAGLQIQPFTELNGEILNYPLGFNDVGNDKLEQYKQVSHFFYMGSEDINNPAQIDIKDGEKKAFYSSNYTDKEVNQIDKMYKGIDQQSRFEVNKMIYEDLGIDSSFKKYQGDHEKVQANNQLSNDVIDWVNSKTKKQELTTEKPKVLTNRISNYKPNGFTDALLLALITGFVGGIITTIMINIII